MSNSNQNHPDAGEEETSDNVEVQGSGVRGSGRTIFHLVKILGDLIDDELTVSDAHKFAGKKVDKVKRVVRVGTGIHNKVSNAVGQAKLGCSQDNCEPPFSWF